MLYVRQVLRGSANLTHTDFVPFHSGVNQEDFQ
jgi:hypothetical protein